MPRKFQAGKRAGFREELMYEDRRAWLKNYLGQFVLRISKPDEVDPAPTESVWLVISRTASKTPLLMNLTSLTLEELQLTRRFLNATFDIAEPLCAERDKVAADALNEGDDSHFRVYRAVPQLVVRPGQVDAHSEVLRDRLADVSEGPRGAVGTTGDVRAEGDAVADLDTRDPVTQDDVPPPDQPA